MLLPLHKMKHKPDIWLGIFGQNKAGFPMAVSWASVSVSGPAPLDHLRPLTIILPPPGPPTHANCLVILLIGLLCSCSLVHTFRRKSRHVQKFAVLLSPGLQFIALCVLLQWKLQRAGLLLPGNAFFGLDG